MVRLYIIKDLSKYFVGRWTLPFCWIIFAIFVNFYHILNRLTQQRVEEGDRIRKLSPKERLKLLKETLKKSTTLTEKLLRRLDKKWDNIYKEDSENGKSFILFLSSNDLFLREIRLDPLYSYSCQFTSSSNSKM